MYCTARLFSRFCFGLLLTANSFNVIAFELETLSDEELSAEEKAWLEDDSGLNTALVNEGQLTFVDPELTAGKYALFNQIRFLGDSMQSRQIAFTQCHKHLDAIRAIDIVYNAQTISDLQVTSSKNIENYQVENDKVELYQVGKDAEICISGKSKTLSYNPESQLWELQRGPYMRKFLDGYYPMHLQESIQLSNSEFDFQQIHLAGNTQLKPLTQIEQNGEGKTITLNYYFEGRLQPTYQFTRNHR